jgi:hypothetical protein
MPGKYQPSSFSICFMPLYESGVISKEYSSPALYSEGTGGTTYGSSFSQGMSSASPSSYATRYLQSTGSNPSRTPSNVPWPWNSFRTIVPIWTCWWLLEAPFGTHGGLRSPLLCVGCDGGGGGGYNVVMVIGVWHVVDETVVVESW